MKKILVMVLAAVLWIPATGHSSEQQRTINARVTVSGLYDAAATSVTLKSGQGLNLPDPATMGAYMASWWNAKAYPSASQDPKGEIVLVTAKVGDVLTVTRAQGGTSASTKNTSGGAYVLYVGYITVIIKDSDVGIIQSAPITVTGAVTSACPITVASSVLPTGAATEATLALLNGKVTACDTGNVTVSSSALPTGAATEATLDDVKTKIPTQPNSISPGNMDTAIVGGTDQGGGVRSMMFDDNGKLRVNVDGWGDTSVTTIPVPVNSGTPYENDGANAVLGYTVLAVKDGSDYYNVDFDAPLPVGGYDIENISQTNTDIRDAVTLTATRATSILGQVTNISNNMVGAGQKDVTGAQAVALATDHPPVTITGTLTSSVLPTGAATEATLALLNGKVTACDTGNVTVSSSALPTGAATEATLLNIFSHVAQETSLDYVATEVEDLNSKVTACDTGAVVVSTSALPTGAATEATLSALNTKAVTMNTGAVVVSTFPDNEPFNMAQVGGNAISTGSGASGTGTQRVILANNQDPVTVRVNTSALPTGAATEASLQGVEDEITSLDGKAVTINTGAVNVTQLNGVGIAMNAGNASTGTQRVVVATDQSTIPVSMATNAIGGGRTIQTAFLNATNSGATTIVAPLAGNRTFVVGYTLSNNGTAKINAFLNYTNSLSATNRVGGGTLAADGGGEAVAIGQYHKTDMSQNQALCVNLSGAGDVNAVVHYYQAP